MDRGTVEWLISMAFSLVLWLISADRAATWVRRLRERLDRSRISRSEPQRVSIRAATERDFARPVFLQLAAAEAKSGASAVVSTPALIRGAGVAGGGSAGIAITLAATQGAAVADGGAATAIPGTA